MTDQELFAILRPIVMSVTGVPECILADPNKPSPLGVYASIRPRQSVRERGQANIYRANTALVPSPIGPVNDLQVDVRAQIMCDVSIQFYRGAAMQMAESLKQCNKRPSVSAALFKNKIGWNGTSAVNNLTSLQSNNWEQRSEITMTLMYETSSKETMNAIYSAQVIVQNEKADILEQFTVGVTP